MKNTTIASFRVPQDDWEKFQEYAKGKDKTASALIKNFINLCLSGGLDENVETAIAPPDIDPDVEIAIANATRPLENRIKTLEEKLNK